MIDAQKIKIGQSLYLVSDGYFNDYSYKTHKVVVVKAFNESDGKDIRVFGLSVVGKKVSNNFLREDYFKNLFLKRSEALSYSKEMKIKHFESELKYNLGEINYYEKLAIKAKKELDKIK